MQGSIQTGSYERDGVRRTTFDIRADQVEFLSRANGNGTGTGDATKPAKDTAIDELKEVEDDDMPF